MKLRQLGVVPASLLTLGLAACGGSNGPDVQKVKADFNNPSGSTKDQQGIAAAAGAQENMDTTGAAGIAGGGGAPGFGLRVQGGMTNSEFAPFVPHNLLAGHIDELRNLLLGKQTFALGGGANGSVNGSASLLSQCVDASKVQAQLQGQLQGAAADFAKTGHASFDISLSVDLSGCASSGYTGSFDLEEKGSIDESATSASVTVQLAINLHNVCQTVSSACVTGGMAEEVAIAGARTTISAPANGTMGTDTSGSSGNINFTLAWDFTATKGADKIHSKGGERLAAAGMNGSGTATYELLFYVKDSKLAEVSYVLKVSANTNGQASLEIRGSDGTLSCTRASDGSGSCTGTDKSGATIMETWDAGTYAAAKVSAKA